jgi:hypothetical protein
MSTHLIMRRSIITLCTFAAVPQIAFAEPANYASRRYLTEFQGSVLKATQFLGFKGEDLATCHSLLTLANGLDPQEQTVSTGCSIARASLDGSVPGPIPSPDDLYITYEHPALRGRTSSVFTVYHLSPSQLAASGICRQLIASFHRHHVNASCHLPKAK